MRKAGGNPGRIGGRKGGSGRFNAHGRSAKAVASFPRDGGSWQRDSIGRFRSRRVVVKARVVKLAPQRGSRGPKVRGASQAADAHLRYLERDGVTRDGERGRAYSAFENEADGRAFIERGRDDRHQFRLIVAPEDAVEMDDLRGFTRDLMRRMEQDLDTRLDWIAVDHHNTGHPHTHIIVRGVLDDGRILNIAGDYIAHGIRHRASELVTLELGPQTEIDIARKLASEVEAERLTRLDRMLIAESQERGMVDLRPDAAESYTVRANRHLLIDRAKRLERYDLATETEPGRWTLSAETEPTLKALGERNDIIKTMHRALAEHGLAEERGPTQYVTHGNRIAEPVMGRVLAKGLAGDELGDRLHLVIDGVDGAHPLRRDGGRLDAGRDQAGPYRLARPGADQGRAQAGRPQHPDCGGSQWRHLPAEPASGGDTGDHRAAPRRPGRLHPFPCPPAGGACAAPAMSSASTPTIGKSPRTSPSEAWPMTRRAGPRTVYSREERDRTTPPTIPSVDSYCHIRGEEVPR